LTTEGEIMKKFLVFMLLSAPAHADPFLEVVRQSTMLQKTGNSVQVGTSEGYGLAIIATAGSTPVRYAELLQQQGGRWLFIAIVGGSVNSLPDLERWAVANGFPRQVAQHLAKDANLRRVRIKPIRRPSDPNREHLYQDLDAEHSHSSDSSPAVMDSVFDSVKNPHFAAVRTPEMEFAENGNPRRLGWWIQLFQLKAKHWTLVAEGHTFRRGFDVGAWAVKSGLPASLGRLSDPAFVEQRLPGE
jgi:hypothetical protein